MTVERWKVEEDTTVGMSYVHVRGGVEVMHTLNLGLVNVDVGPDGEAVGVEFFGLLSEPEDIPEPPPQAEESVS